MRKQYDDFTQLKVKDMSKSISDMTYTYINPETNTPTVVPPNHYEKILNKITEKHLADVTKRQFLMIMYNQLTALKKEDEKYFQQALICMDMGINPKDLRVNEQVALAFTSDYYEEKKNVEKGNFHFLDRDIVNAYEESLNNPEIQAQGVNMSNLLEKEETLGMNNRRYSDRDER